jgi:acylphosphatase
MNTGMGRVNIIVRGLVQGVYFRDSTRRQARQLGITGWVKNRWEGSVEVLAEGEKEKLDRLVAWCTKGPSHAVVEGIETEWRAFQGEFQDFTITY